MSREGGKVARMTLLPSSPACSLNPFLVSYRVKGRLVGQTLSVGASQGGAAGQALACGLVSR